MNMCERTMTNCVLVKEKKIVKGNKLTRVYLSSFHSNIQNICYARSPMAICTEENLPISSPPVPVPRVMWMEKICMFACMLRVCALCIPFRFSAWNRILLFVWIQYKFMQDCGLIFNGHFTASPVIYILRESMFTIDDTTNNNRWITEWTWRSFWIMANS